MPTDGVHDPIGNKRKCGLAACNNDLDSNASRTRAACPARGRGCPDSEQQAHVRMRRPRLEITGLRALRRARCRAVPLLSHAGRLSRTRAACPARGPPVPYVGGVAQARNSRPTCG